MCASAFLRHLQRQQSGGTEKRAHPESNRAPTDLRSVALAAELCTREIKRSFASQQPSRREEGARQVCKGVGLGAGAKMELGFPSTTRIRSETGKMVARKAREKIRGLSAGEGYVF